jgi:hypothetical protein
MTTEKKVGFSKGDRVYASEALLDKLWHCTGQRVAAVQHGTVEWSRDGAYDVAWDDGTHSVQVTEDLCHVSDRVFTSPATCKGPEGPFCEPMQTVLNDNASRRNRLGKIAVLRTDNGRNRFVHEGIMLVLNGHHYVLEVCPWCAGGVRGNTGPSRQSR